ncbi:MULTISPECIES: hypothetical protein [unclassified Pseudofrankia]|nr:MULTISPECIES: hypothetical protein [unclassified Pseudofrankia]MDT3443183.1 hypothetical protein [Pseudofrankia sp. BMG5.37]
MSLAPWHRRLPLEWGRDTFTNLTVFLRDAATGGDAVLTWID